MVNWRVTRPGGISCAAASKAESVGDGWMRWRNALSKLYMGFNKSLVIQFNCKKGNKRQMYRESESAG